MQWTRGSSGHGKEMIGQGALLYYKENKHGKRYEEGDRTDAGIACLDKAITLYAHV